MDDDSQIFVLLPINATNCVPESVRTLAVDAIVGNPGQVIGREVEDDFRVYGIEAVVEVLHVWQPHDAQLGHTALLGPGYYESLCLVELGLQPICPLIIKVVHPLLLTQTLSETNIVFDFRIFLYIYLYIMDRLRQQRGNYGLGQEVQNCEIS